MNSKRATRLYNQAQRRMKREEKKLFNECFKKLRKIVFQHILECAEQGFTNAYIWEDNLIITAFDNFPKIPPVREVLEKIKMLLERRGFVVKEEDVQKNKYGRLITYSNKRWDISPKQLTEREGDNAK